MTNPDEAINEIAETIGVMIVPMEMEMDRFGFFNSDYNAIAYNNKLGPVTRRMVILHELGHALSYKRLGEKKTVIDNIKHEYAANQFMIRYEVEQYINEVGLDHFTIENFMSRYEFPDEFKPFVRRMIKKALKIK